MRNRIHDAPDRTNGIEEQTPVPLHEPVRDVTPAITGERQISVGGIIQVQLFRSLCIVAGIALVNSTPIATASDALDLKSVVRQAYAEVHDGWSTDEVLLQDELNQKFVTACRQFRPEESQYKLNWTMLNLRKAGQLKAEVTKRRRDQHQAYRHLAEIAARTIQDKHRVNTDRMMCDEKLRCEFDRQARLLAKDVDPYLLRKAAFGLRKTRRLKPELILRVADWDREITVYRAAELSENLLSVPESPGIYIFATTRAIFTSVNQRIFEID